MKAKLKFFEDKTLYNFSLLQYELRKIPTHWALCWAWLQKRADSYVGEIVKITEECFIAHRMLEWKRPAPHFK